MRPTVNPTPSAGAATPATSATPMAPSPEGAIPARPARRFEIGTSVTQKQVASLLAVSRKDALRLMFKLWEADVVRPAPPDHAPESFYWNVVHAFEEADLRCLLALGLPEGKPKPPYGHRSAWHRRLRYRRERWLTLPPEPALVSGR